MGKKSRKAAVEQKGPVETTYLCAPAAILLFLALTEILLSIQDPWFTNRAFWVHHQTLKAATQICFAACAILALSSRLRAAVCSHLEKLGALPSWEHRAWLAAGYLGIFGLFLFIKYCQHRGFQLPGDTADTVNIAYNFLRHHTFESSPQGIPSYLGVHFMPVIAVFSLVLLLWKSAMGLIAAQTIWVASVPIAVYALVYSRTKSSLAAWSGLWLTFTSPFLFNLESSSLALQVCLPAFFLWGIYFAERRRWMPAALFFLLMAISNEAAMISFFALGAYLVFKLGAKERRSWLIGGLVCASAVAAGLLERRLMSQMPISSGLVRGWPEFSWLGATPIDAVEAALLHPLAFAAKIVFPISNLEPLWRIMWTTGFFCLLAWPELIPCGISYLPSFLAKPGPGTTFHNLHLHYSAYVLGPILWACAAGMANAYNTLSARNRQSWVLVFVLFIGGLNLNHATRTLLPEWNPRHFAEAPGIISQIPEDVSLWSGEFMSSWVATRCFLKFLRYEHNNDREFDNMLFMPDYVLMDKAWVVYSKPDWGVQVLSYFAREGYIKAAESSLILLLKHPKAPLVTPGQRPPPLVWPKAEAASARRYAEYLIR